MMVQQVDYSAFAAMFHAAASEIRSHHALLSHLDSAGGDGDHGATMLRAMTRLEEAVTASAPGELQSLLQDVGWAILGVDGGATGPLLGMFFVAMAEAVDGRTALDAPELASVFDAGLAGVRAQTQAQPGDKTMIDALAPAVEALRESSPGQEPCAMMARAADAARSGAEATKAMQARFGRARNIKEKSIGTQDPGATSVALLFNGFMKGLDQHAGRG